VALHTILRVLTIEEISNHYCDKKTEEERVVADLMIKVEKYMRMQAKSHEDGLTVLTNRIRNVTNQVEEIDE